MDEAFRKVLRHWEQSAYVNEVKISNIHTQRVIYCISNAICRLHKSQGIVGEHVRGWRHHL